MELPEQPIKSAKNFYTYTKTEIFKNNLIYLSSKNLSLVSPYFSHSRLICFNIELAF